MASTPDKPSEHDGDGDGDVAVDRRTHVRKPKRFKVVLHNDNYTTMDFVVEVLMKFFQKSETEASRIMLLVHHRGEGIAGVYSRDVAESKVAQVTHYARDRSMPLLVTAEPE